MGIIDLLRPKKRRTPTKKAQSVDRTKTGAIVVVLDHPAKGEKITTPDYTLRIGVFGEVARVEVSVDDGPWQPCRESVGYWWYDWSNYTKGNHWAVARAFAKDGSEVDSKLRKFRVALETAGRPRCAEMVAA